MTATQAYRLHSNISSTTPPHRDDEAEHQQTVRNLIDDQESGGSSVPSLDHPPSQEVGNLEPQAETYPAFSLPVLALLAPASIFGVLARLGLQALATYDGSSIFPLAYPQTLGCFIMGFCLSFKPQIGDFYGPLYTALTTGFCGSLTTFSGWQYDVYTSWDNSTDRHRGGLRDAVDGITKTVATLLLSLGAFAFGVHLGSQIPRPKTVPFVRAIYRRSCVALSILTYAASFLTYFLLPAIYRHQVTAALLFSYPGTLTRYALSIKLNSRFTGFPLGTFVANIFGTAVLGALHVVQNNPHAVPPTACSLIQGLADGYCGCLTTISTFAGEVLAFKDRRAWRYVLTSWTVGQIVLAIILQPSFHAEIAKTQKCTFT